jgi:hypothetical protein
MDKIKEKEENIKQFDLLFPNGYNIEDINKVEFDKWIKKQIKKYKN